MDYDTAVVGAGPAGLFAAIASARSGARTVALERMASPARKLLISGSGQCNLTHAGPISSFLGRYGEAGRFLRPALYGFDNEALTAFFRERGLPLEETGGGKVFPASRRARDVLEALLAELRSLGVELRLSDRVRGARRADGRFLIDAERGAVRASALIVAAGGASYPKTGSTGDGWALAASFGHRVVETAPALTPVYAETAEPASFAPFAACAGIALRDASVAVYRSGRKAAAGRGDVLFTHRGLSGPGILDLSRSMRPGDELRISLAPGSGNEAEVDARLLQELSVHGKRTVTRVLRAFGLPDALARALLASAGVPEEAVGATLPKAARRVLALALAEGGEAGRPFRIASLGGWEEAMATRGGVDRSEVDPKRMESLLVPGLFFAGETLDADGDTGGFNIQAACSTGLLAGTSAAGQAR